jgi:hypothetical protein
MKFPILILLASFAVGQSTVGGSAAAGSFTISGTATQLPNFAQLPLNWADDQECNPPGGVFDITRIIGVNYTANAAGLNLAIQDWATSGVDQWEALQVPFGTFTTASPLVISSQVTLLGKPGATKCLVIMGTGSIVANQTLCSHQIIDNIDGSSPRNLGCTNDIAQLATIEGRWNSGNNGMLFQACTIGGANCAVGANHIAIKNLELRFQAGNTYGGQGVILMSLNDGDQSGLLGSNHTWLLQNYLHADASETATAANKVSTIISYTSCSNCGAAYNYFDKVLSLGSESHIITDIWTPGPLKVVGNWVEGSSIPIFFGGAGSTVLPYENIYDVEIRHNRFTHSPAWMPLSGALSLKSSGELKTCSRCLIDGNIFENSNTSGGQKGQGFTLTVRNTSGGATGENYNNSIDNITFTNNVIRHTVTGIESASRSGSAGNGGGATKPGVNWFIGNDLFYDIAPGTSQIFNNTVNIPFIVEVGGGSNNWTASSAVRDPTGKFVTLTLVDGGPGLHKTTMSVGDLVHVQGCTDTTFNTPKHGGTFFAEGPIALAGTQSFITVAGNPVPGPVVYPNVGTPNATSAGCLVFNNQGFQKGSTVSHITVAGGFVGASGAKGQVPSCLAIDTYALNSIFQDNLIVPQPTQYAGLNCQGDGNTEGTVSENNMWDPSTAIFNHNVIGPNSTGVRNANLYTDYPGGISPSVANWFPISVGCASPTADASCIGFTSMMNGAPYQANAPTIDGYSLDPSSIYIAGQSRQASDGKSLGADIAAIKAAQQATQYVCPTPCGTGPKPD